MRELLESPLFCMFFSIRVINAGKSMLNEDQASCEKLFVRKPSGKHRNSTLLDDKGVRLGEKCAESDAKQRALVQKFILCDLW